MGLLTKTVVLKWNNKTRKHYENKGYKFTEYGKEFIAKIEDVSTFSRIRVNVKCDECGKISEVSYQSYATRTKEKYYCKTCANRLFSGEKSRIDRLSKSISFEQWCLDNNELEILKRWDYELNEYKPSEVSYRTNKDCYLKCGRGLHDSEPKRIRDLVRRGRKSLECNKCNSFVQWGIDNIDVNFLEKYWDYDLNKNVNPLELSYGTMKNKVWIKCQRDKKHGSYLVSCGHFSSDGSRCPICCYSKGEQYIEKYLLDRKIYNIPQKEFNGLLGLRGKNLIYDFYLPEQNILIEFQGVQHKKFTVGFHKSKRDFEKQLEHDRRKRKYAENNNIKLIEIWYWEYDNIEKILNDKI